MDPLREQTAAAIERANAENISHMLCVSVELNDVVAINKLIAQYPNIFGSVGVHPSEARVNQALFDDLVKFTQTPRMIAIGETGLDYYHTTDYIEEQKKSFRIHIAAARQAHKPLIIHTREAAADTLAILREEGADKVGGILHCFTESEAVARQALDLNFYISFSGIVTFKNAQSLRDVAAFVPEDRILIETDAPYLAPAPYRGKVNEPSYVQYVASCLAAVRHVSTEYIAERTTKNFFTLFSRAMVIE